MRDGTVCSFTLTPDQIVAPWSDIHQGVWDDALAIGFGRAMRAYVGFYETMHHKLWPVGTVGTIKPEDVLERDLNESAGVRIVGACGAARGDMLDLRKSCG